KVTGSYRRGTSLWCPPAPLNRHRSEKTFVFIFALFDMSRCC
ncbi:unnamed protein product, partial [Brassica oleracea var. botrytis]